MSDKLDLDPDVFMRGLLDAADRSFVNPRCDECNFPLPPQRTMLGPHLCASCRLQIRLESAAARADFESQERSDRRVHIVKLPPGMMKDSSR